MQERVEAIVFTAKVGRDRLLLLAYADGGWGIERNDQPLEGCRWADEDLDAAIEAFRQMTSERLEAR